MSKLVAKCGIDCGACPWGPYPRKGLTAEEFERYRTNAKRILGYMPITAPKNTAKKAFKHFSNADMQILTEQ